MRQLHPLVRAVLFRPAQLLLLLLLLLLLVLAGAAVAQPTITGLGPARNARAAAPGSSVAVTFSQAMSSDPASAAGVKVFSSQRGGLLNVGGGTASVAGSTITFDPATSFRPGETIYTTITTAVASQGGNQHLAQPHVYQFTAAAGAGPGTFIAAPKVPTADGQADNLTLGDVNTDGFLDLFVVNGDDHTVSLHLGLGNGAFGPGTVVSAGINHCMGLKTADVDNDGDLDLLVMDRNSDQLWVHLNNGTGTFGSGTALTLPLHPLALMLGDIDGDADLDMVIGCEVGVLAVRFNNGSGGFFPGIDGTTNTPLSLAMGDIDGDGDLDVVSASRVSLNNGAGVFTTSYNMPHAAGVDAGGVLGDLDGDGDLDLAVSHYDEQTVWVRLNNGSGTFGPEQIFPVPGSGPTSFDLALADVEGDGDLDLLVDGDQTRLLRNNGNGTFAASVAINTPGGYLLATGDVDNDGDLDFLTSDMDNGGVHVRLNGEPLLVTALAPTRNRRNAARTGPVAVTFNQPISGAGASVASVQMFSQQRGGKLAGTASANGNTITFDPAQDFKPGETVYTTITTAAQSSGGGSLTIPQVYQFTAAATGGTGTFGPGADLPAGGPNAQPYHTATGDIDGDGDLDIVTANNGLTSNTLGIRLNNGNATFTAAADVVAGTNPHALILGDVDGDGDLDLLVDISGGVLVLHNSGAGTFSHGQTLSTTFAAHRMALGDLDGDGDLDLGLTAGTEISLHANNGSGVFGPGVFMSTSTYTSDIAFGDLDNDGDLDVLVGNQNENNIGLRFNNGSGTFGAMSTVNVAAGPTDLALGDIDGDGDLDFVTSSLNAHNASVRRNNGNGTFSGGSNPALPLDSYAVALGDVDGDGDLDLLATTGASTVVRLLNAGNGTFGSSSGTPLAGAFEALNLADLDDDGDLDLVIGSYTTDSVYVRLNGPSALPDLVVDTVTPVTGGPYNNVTVTGTGVGTLAADLSVAGTLRIEDGGVLSDGCFTITGPGSFVLEAGGTLGICSAQGIGLAGATGTVQVAGSRSYSDDASYVYHGSQAQVTGDGLPASVRNLSADNPARVRLSGSVAVRRVLTIANAGNLQLAGHNLLLPSDATGTAMVVNSGPGIVENDGAGTATMQRHLSPSTAYAGPGYRHYSSPMQASRVADLATPGFTPYVDPAYNALPTPNLPAQFPNVFGYQESRLTAAFPGFDTGWFSPAALSDALSVTRGYTVNISPAARVALTGALNTGPLNTGALSRGFGAEAGWHLLGNPYPAPLDWGRVTSTPGALPAGLADAIYVFEPGSQYGGFYRSYVNGIGTQGFNGVLPAMQGFFVRVTQAVPAGFTFRDEFRLTQYADPAFHRPAAGSQPLLRLTLSGGSGGTDETVVYLEQGATPAGTDARYDAAKLPNPGRSVSLASQMPGAGNEALAINGLPLLSAAAPATRVPLQLSLPAAGTYRLSRATLANFDPALAITLLDHGNGTRTDLRATAGYAFTAAQAGSLSGRFELLLGRPGTATAATAGAGLSFSVWPNPAGRQQALHLSLDAPAKAATATLLNVLGQVVATHSFSGAASEISTRTLAAGTYLLTVQVPGRPATTRRVVLE